MTLVLLSIAVLAVAPLIAVPLKKSAPLAALVDSFVLVTVAGVVALHVVPQSAGLAGPLAVVFALAGLFLPILLHRLDATDALSQSEPGRRARDAVLLALFCAGLFVHGMFDGAALSGSAPTAPLALGVLLHRVPVGLALWVVVRPKLGVARLAIVVAAYAGGTLLGGAWGGAVLAVASAPALALLQAFVAGSILHIVAEAPPFSSSASGAGGTSPIADDDDLAASAPLATRMGGVVGAVLAALVLFVIEDMHGEHLEPAGLGALDAFVTMSFMAAPAVALSFVLVGVLTALYPDGAPPIARRGGRIVDAAAGVAAGLPHPLCSCSVAPLYTSLLERGASLPSARAFLVAAPELGVPAVLLSARFLGLPFTLARVVAAAVLALVVGSLSARSSEGGGALTSGRRGEAPGARAARGEAAGARAMRGIKHGLVDAVDHTGPWILLGLAAAAFVEATASEGALASVPAPLATALLALAAFPLYLCAAGSTPLAAMLVHKGASVGAALAFLLVGPATSLPTISLLKRLHGARAAAMFCALVVASAVAVGMVVDLSGVGPSLSGQIDVALHARAEEGASMIEIVAALIVVALLVASLVRQGVRGFVVQIMSPQHSHQADHAHGPGCGHDHGPPLAPPRLKVNLDFDPRVGR